MRRKMDFFRWRDMYHDWRNRSKENRKKPMWEIYKEIALWLNSRKDVPGMLACMAENEWFKYGNPYYKVYPQMAHALANISIEIDSKYLHLPFPTYEVCLPKSDCFRETSDSPAVCSLLVHRENYLRDMASEYGLEALLEETMTENSPELTTVDRDWSFLVHYQLDSEVASNWYGWYFRMGLKEGTTIAEQFEKAWTYSKNKEDTGLYVPSKEFALKLTKMAIAIAFFGIHSHEMVMEDIPNKFIERWHKSKREKNESEAKKILDKAKKMGHFGWRVGQELALPRPIVKHMNEPSNEQSKNELTFGHIRSGHLRLQPKGKKEKPDYELIFVHPTVVRPDLPLRDMRGFRIEDELLRRKVKQPSNS